VDQRGRAPRRRRAVLARRRFARRASAPEPTPVDMETGKRRGSRSTASGAPSPIAASGANRCATPRARLLQPGASAAHPSSTESERDGSTDPANARELSRRLARRAGLEGTAEGTTTRAMGPAPACADPRTRPSEPAGGQPHSLAAAGETPETNGEGGIRTPDGPMAHTGFRDRRIQPLCHLSGGGVQS